MTREEAKELLPIIQAFAEGKAIQDKIEGLTDWCDTDEINLKYNGQKIIHRIKPEPKYRPFKSREECWQEMHKHPDFGWVFFDGEYESIKLVSDYSIYLLPDESINYELAVRDIMFSDGAPFGIKEE